MKKYTCEHDGCEETSQYLLSNAAIGKTHEFCRKHFTLYCAAYLFAFVVNDLPDRDELMACHDGLYFREKVVDRG